MPHDHTARIAELEAELKQFDENAHNGLTGLSQQDIQRTRGQIMRRIAQRHQDTEAHAIAEQQEAARPETPADGG